MANMNPIRKRIWRIYLVAALLILCCCLLVACNNDNSYSVAGDVSEPTHFMAKFMLTLSNSSGLKNASFGWTVVVFTIILRLILSPLDLWQKIIARRNSKAMERMKPQLEALNEKYADDKQRLQQEQMALYKKEHYSMLGMCLPTIATFVVFFVVFAGFRQMVGYQYALDYKSSVNAFSTVVEQEVKPVYGDRNGDGVIDLTDIDPEDPNASAFRDATVEKAQLAVYDAYYSDEQKNTRSWLWIKNIFVSDNWSQSVPTYTSITGQSGFATSRLSGVDPSEYNMVMGKVLGTGGYGKDGKWNGLLILPALSILLSFLSTFLLNKSQSQPPQPQAGAYGQPNQANSMKMMQWIMPIMMGVFSLLYSGAFALYMFTSSAAAILFQLSFNLVGKLIDISQERKHPSNIAKR
ncbi:MAG: membrane protein insertase YidC [Clostridia bacterium]|nr:membrane protein insertase YidC [Clostridia bacterium]